MSEGEDKDFFDPQVQDLLRLCLARDPAQRPRASALLEHPWVTKMEKLRIDHMKYAHEFRQTLVSKILRNFSWLKYITPYEISLFKQMDQMDFFTDMNEAVESHFKGFDVAQEHEG